VNAPPELALGSAQIPECSGQGNGEQVEVIRPAIGEDVVCLTPDTLIGIEFRRVCREALQVKAGISAAEFAKRFALVGSAIVPDNDEVAA
jgi:hypothetical protein